jgi:Fe-Mn family superoxide dismutase
MAYEAKNYDSLLGASGFSDQLLKNHFTLYQSYVANTNKTLDSLKKMELEQKTGTPEYSELKRRFAWEFNGMRLHELYFENIKKTELNENSKIAKKIIEDFESMEKWVKDFKATGAMRGIGWVVLYHDKTSNKLFNVWVNEHDVGHLTGATPLLVMDVFEHAYMIDYQLKKADYIEAFFKEINWNAVEKRL